MHVNKREVQDGASPYMAGGGVVHAQTVMLSPVRFGEVGA